MMDGFGYRRHPDIVTVIEKQGYQFWCKMVLKWPTIHIILIKVPFPDFAQPFTAARKNMQRKR